MSEKSSLTLHPEMNLCQFGGTRWYIKCYSRKEGNEIAWLLGEVWKLKGIRRNTDKGRCPLCLGEKDVKTHTTGLFQN
jgi:hypothetical protein